MSMWNEKGVAFMTKSKPKPYQNKIQQVSRSFQKFYVETSQLRVSMASK